MTTPAQAAARAENGKKHSTGPKTQAGKEASRANALRHGMYARTVAVVPHGPLAEDPDLYEGFCEGVLEDLGPFGTTEDDIAQSIADLMWRGARVPLYEAHLLANSSASIEWEAAFANGRADDVEMAAAEAMDDLDADHPIVVLERAAIELCFLVGIDMDDGWPLHRPTDQAGWVQLIRCLLTDHGLAIEEAAKAMRRNAEAHRAEQARLAGLRFSQAVDEAVGQKQLASLMRAEAHLTRELARKVALLRQLQAMRLERGSM